MPFLLGWGYVIWLSAMTNAQILLSLLMGLHPYKEDVGVESYDDRTARMTIVSEATDFGCQVVTCSGPFGESVEGCKPVWRAPIEECYASVLAQGWGESRYAKDIHLGICKTGQCDPVIVTDDGKREVVRQAWGPWQVQPTTVVARKVFSRIRTPDLDLRQATWSGAWAAAYSLSINVCGGNRLLMFGAQLGQGCQVGPTSKLRVEKYRSFLARYRQLRRKHPVAAGQ